VAMTDLPTVLVSMPFMNTDRPSIQLGLLKAIGEAHGFTVRTLHANLDFAARIGLDRYRLIADHYRRLVGEWLFSVEAFGDAAPDRDARLLAEFGDELGQSVGGPELLLRMREHDVPAYLDGILDGFPWAGVKVVGFSSTFQQNTASFALARRLKQRFPDIVTVFGGANFDGDMGPELVRTVDVIDYAILGEGDTAFPALLTALAAGADPTGVPGVATRARTTRPAPPTTRLDDLPVPDYTEYFDRAAALGVATDETWLPFESARGCWWGAKHHCTFCGLNGSTMTFRAKSPDRVRAELAGQARRYRNFRFEAVDNILDPRYLKEFFPALAESDYRLFYEVKANLTREQVRTLAHGGVTDLQPGIESLSTPVLRLMDKGVRAGQNVNLLRWARYHGMNVAWNILYGFPGESAADYAAQAAAAAHLVHLQPPSGANQISLERFSPLFEQPERFHLPLPVPEASHRHVYPSTMDVDKVAYFFEYEPALPASAYEPLRKAVTEWQSAWRGEPPILAYRATPGLVQIYDTRHPGHEGVHTFHDALADIYVACTDRPTTAAAVHQRTGTPLSAVEEAFTRFHAHGLMFLDEDRALSLAIPASPGH
jgi:ribosomal peptide maturation radical SAM protein 1